MERISTFELPNLLSPDTWELFRAQGFVAHSNLQVWTADSTPGNRTDDEESQAKLAAIKVLYGDDNVVRGATFSRAKDGTVTINDDAGGEGGFGVYVRGEPSTESSLK